MSVILGKYKNKKRLGKGAYGDVLLVEDNNGKQYALKMISKRSLKKEPYLQQYLDGEKDCMISAKNKYIMDLHYVQEDQNYVYFVCEFCEGGDLLNYQAKQEKRVFTLQMTCKILSQVIQGLYFLHSKNYLHRDIKPQNILLKKVQNGEYVRDFSLQTFKLADFGFAKKVENIGGTVLGTQHYMSPEIYGNQIYSYEVDMWAFGVLMYFMLNMEFPFKINPHFTLEQKRQELIKQSYKFSYAEHVKKSKKKLMQNCNAYTEDLFGRIFESNVEKRITFAEVRQHNLFKKYFFDEDDQMLKQVYSHRFQDKLQSFIQQRSGIHKIPKNQFNKPKNPELPKVKKDQNTQQNIQPSYIIRKVRTTEQKQILEFERDRIDFLLQCIQDISTKLDFLDASEILALRYNILKYYIILLRQFILTLKPEIYQQRYPKKKWKQFFNTNIVNIIKKQCKDNLDQAEIKLSQTHDQCKTSLDKVRQYNPKIQLVLQPEATQKAFEGKFKQSYRMSTITVYGKVRQKFSNGNIYVYLTVLVTLCYSYNHIIKATNQELESIFSGYMQDTKARSIDFSELQGWLTRSDKQKLKNVIVSILNKYFS